MGCISLRRRAGRYYFFFTHRALKRADRFFQAAERSVFAQDLHDRPKVGRVRKSRRRDTEHFGYVRNVAGERRRVGFIRFHIGGETVCARDRFDLFEPNGAIVRVVVRRLEIAEYLFDGRAVETVGVFGFERLVEEVAYHLHRLFRANEVFSAFLAADAHTQREYFTHIFLIRKVRFLFVRAELVRPSFEEVVRFRFRELGHIRFGNVVEFENIEQRAALTHFADRVLELVDVFIGEFEQPFLEVGIEQGHHIRADRRGVVALFAVERERRLGVFALGKLSARFPVYLLNGTVMTVLGEFEPEHFEKFDMDRKGGQPFLAANDEGGTHKMVVYRVREVIGRDTVRFENDDVLIVLGDGDLPFHLVAEGMLDLDVALRFQADHVRFARFQIFVYLFFGQIAALGEFAVVAGQKFMLRLVFARFFQFLFRTETGIRKTAADKVFRVSVVDLRALALVVRTVVAAKVRALVERHAEIFKGSVNDFHRALDLTFVVGVLDTEIEHAAALVRDTFVCQRDVKIPDMHKAGGAGRKAGDLRALFQRAFGIALFVVFERFYVPVGDKRVRKFVQIHNSIYLLLYIFSTDKIEI